jgi:serine/threonine-protein kinase RsbW
MSEETSQFFKERYRQTLNLCCKDDILIAMGITEKLARAARFSDDESILLRLVTEEACMNASEHGTPHGYGNIEVSWLVDSGTMVISVSQNGEEFEIPKGLQANLEPRGRGLALIQGIMDEIRLIPTGAGVTLWMRIDRRNKHE